MVLMSRTNGEAASLLLDAPSPIVVVSVYNAHDEVMRCLESVVAHTCSSIAILVIDDAGPDRRAIQLLQTQSDQIAHRIVVLEHRDNQGYVRSCNDAFAATIGRDVVLLNSDVIVGPEWLERLTAAALSSDLVATATTLTNHGTIVSVPYRNVPVQVLPDHMTPAEAARRVAAGSLQLRPSIPTAVGHCFYVRRHVIDLVGPFDETFDPGYGEEVEFSQRAVAHGFRHVVADDVFTYHRGGSSFGNGPAVGEQKHRHEAIVVHRYPSYGLRATWAAAEQASGLADALAAARRSILGLTVGVDAMCLGAGRMGTQYNVRETIRALVARPEIARLVAFVPPRGVPDVERVRKELPDVEFVSLGDGLPPDMVDLVYRPYQVTTGRELEFLYRAADRFVVNQLDTIAFENPMYFDGHDDWLAYRNLTRLTLKLAHGVAFPSRSARETAQSEGLLDPQKPTAIVGCGVDDPMDDQFEARPAPCAPCDDRFLLCIGASYLHKNHRFALELWTELRRRGWVGRIVFAGPTPPYGNSHARVAEFLLTIPDLRGDVVTLGAITEAEKRWLYQRSALVLYPSTVEGFGLVPFEAARYGVPTLATRQASLDEVLPSEIPVLDGFDVVVGADRAWTLLHDGAAAKSLAHALQERRRLFTWESTAGKLMELFGAALAQPRGRLVALEGEGGKLVGFGANGQALDTLTAHEVALLKAQHDKELAAAREQIAQLITRERQGLVSAREEVERLKARVVSLETALAAVRGTRTWRLHDRLARSSVLRTLFARPGG